MSCFGRDFDQRFKHETPLMHRGVRDLQSLFIDHLISKEDDVDIDVARTFFAHSEASHCRFEVQDKRKQLSRRLLGVNRNCAV